MSYQLTWLPGVLRAAGLKVAEVEGWETRGRGDVGLVKGVMCHHTAGPAHGNMPSLKTLVEGRLDLRGPLAQLGLGRDGTFYVVAAGRCNHAGEGRWRGIATGNSSFIGIEAENTGLPSDPWPAVQMDAYVRGAAALLSRLGSTAAYCAGHREYALPPGRKVDPSFDMASFRERVQAVLDGTAPPPELIPALAPAAAGQPVRPTLRRFATGDMVKQVQTLLGCDADGFFGPKTEAAVRAFQRERKLVPDGIVGPRTWLALDAVEPVAA